ncbi:Enhancer of polycomb-like protein 1, partial [Spiromyces aspiralis]
MGNVQRFRARKVDLRRHMPVYRASELPDLENEDSNRTVDIETGVEKDEEAEHHLQAVISASQAAANGQATKSRLYIPTPSTTKALDDYDRLYPKLFQQPKSLIRTVALYEDIKDNDYCMDEEDEAWLATHNKACAQGALPPATTNTTNTTTTDSSAEPNVPFSQRPLSKSEFEDAMGQLEFLTKHMVFSSEKDIPTLKTLTAYAKERDVEILSNVSVVFDWWKQRKVKREFHQIMPQLLFEDISKTTIDPYVCFRRREVRHGRKTRRADQRSLEHLNRLRLNLLSVAQLLGFCIERETKKSELYAHESTLLAHRSKIISLRRRLGLTEQPFSDLFTLPATQTPSVTSVRRRHTPAQQQLLLDVQPGTVNGAGARNRADSTARRQRQHPGPQSPQPHRVPAIVIPSIPKSLDVSLYSAPQHLLDMVARVQSKVRKYQQDLRDHVDGTFTFKLPSQPSGRQTAQFWSPNVLRFDSQRLQGMSASPQGARNLAFRLRRSPNGWIYLDRRRVLPLCTTPPPQPQLPLSLTALDSDKMQTSSFPELLSRLELYRMGMLTAEDRERLRSLSATSKCPQSLYPDDIPR